MSNEFCLSEPYFYSTTKLLLGNSNISKKYQTIKNPELKHVMIDE